MKSRLLSAAFLLAAIALAAQSTAEVAITAEPHHHLLLENQRVRVWLAEVAPHDATLMHRHAHDYVFVSLGETNVQNEVEGKAPVTLKMQDGETRFSQGGFAHIARDLASTPFRAIAVELLQDEAAHKTPPPAWDEDRGLHIFTGGTQHIMFVQDGVRVSEIELQPGATIPRHHHSGPHLVVAITDFDLRSDVEGQPPASGHIKSGDAKWVPGGFTHALTNTGKQEAKVITLEFQ
jgi:quercetin dioxygenase-like cupin family protein